MVKLYNKPQLGQANLTQSQRTNETGVDNRANSKAAQANRSVDHLLNMAGSAVKIVGKYQDNLVAKDKLQSKQEIPYYTQMMQAELNSIEDFDSMGREAIESKLTELNESFMKRYKDKPYSNQLSQDIEGMRSKVLTSMLGKRDAEHVKKVSSATAESASSLAQQFSDGTLDEESMKQLIVNLSKESTIAYQVPSSTELDLPDESREKYIGLTSDQARDSILKGLMVHTGKPDNSKVASVLANKDFRKMMGIDDSDEEYNKLVANAIKRGTNADKLQYKTGLDKFKNQLYATTNQGISVDVDKQVEQYRANGSILTAQDEHKLRKEFKGENTLVTNSANYIEKLGKGKDITIDMTKKEREGIYGRAFTDILNITGESAIGIADINGSLAQPQEQSEFLSYLKSGGKIPEKVKKMFDVPAGASSQKWHEANAAIMTMEAAATGSGYSIEELIGVKQVSKVRGLSRLLNDDEMDEGTKQNAIKALQSRSASFNSKGYLRGDDTTKIDTDWLNDVSTDASWTTDDYVSNSQNADEIAGNYQAYKLAGLNDSDAQSKALELFKSSNVGFEMPNGDEISRPKAHKYLNNESIIAFSKEADRFPSLKQQRDANISSAIFGDNWYTEWDTNNEISIQKSYNFAKSGEYTMLYKGMPVKDANFTYEEMEDFISTQDHKTRTRITGVETERPFKEIEEEALEQRAKKIETETVDKKLENILRLAL